MWIMKLFRYIRDLDELLFYAYSWFMDSDRELNEIFDLINDGEVF
jgi:hypothetical protein